ncbi:MAG TPA: hypothetical protein VHA56_03245 [Mucilaginibacter sp.]|nr:hypothetical protein [Mucilaginibacter sp.]
MRYFIAYEVAVYGFAKILKTQFAASYSRSDMPVGSLSGLELTWNYFGHSYTYAVILGVCQIGGAVLLMFRRTTLAGVFVLLPVMVNVVLINMFYHISAGAFTNSIIITVGLIYLLLLRWPDIKKLFFGEARHMQFKIIPVGLKLSVRLIILTLAFYNIYQYVAAAKPSAFTGKWNVESVSNNGRSVALGPWKNDFLVWRTVYMENSGRVGLSFNPYVYDLSNTNWGDYTYDPKKHHLLIIYPGFSAQSDTCVVTVSHYDGNKMQWNLTHNYDTLEYRLSKVLASE